MTIAVDLGRKATKQTNKQTKQGMTFQVNHLIAIYTYICCSKILVSNKKGKDPESIQSSATPDPEFQWENDNFTLDITNKSLEVGPFPTADHSASTSL